MSVITSEPVLKQSSDELLIAGIDKYFKANFDIFFIILTILIAIGQDFVVWFFCMQKLTFIIMTDFLNI